LRIIGIDGAALRGNGLRQRVATVGIHHAFLV
jgi:hypothetical protein